MTARRAWMRLPSGQRLDLLAPNPSSWTNADLATRLARTLRWGGESAWPHPLSVAQHSLTVLALSGQWNGTPLDPAVALRELLHDAEEGFLGFDAISPLKAVLGAPFKLVSDRLSTAIAQRYRLPGWDDATFMTHKAADVCVAASEAMHVVGWSPDEVRSVLSIYSPILSRDPLATIYDCAPWEPWASDVAAERFLDALTMYDQLVAATAVGAESDFQPIVGD